MTEEFSEDGVKRALVSKNKSVIAAALKFGQARLSPPTIDQIASEAALDTPQSYFDEVQAEYVERRNIMVDGLNSIPGVFCPKPKGAFYCVAKFPVDNAEKFCQWLLESTCEFATLWRGSPRGLDF